MAVRQAAAGSRNNVRFPQNSNIESKRLLDRHAPCVSLCAVLYGRWALLVYAPRPQRARVTERGRNPRSSLGTTLEWSRAPPHVRRRGSAAHNAGKRRGSAVTSGTNRRQSRRTRTEKHYSDSCRHELNHSRSDWLRSWTVRSHPSSALGNLYMFEPCVNTDHA